MFSHAMEQSDNFKATVAEFHNRPLTQKHLKPQCRPVKNGIHLIQLASLPAR